MSYYLYKDKRVFELEDGRYFFLAKIGDSSVRDWDGKIPYHWSLITELVPSPSMLFSKKDLEEQKKRMLKYEEDSYKNSCEKYGWDMPKNIMEAATYAGTTHRGSRKVKAKLAYYSTRKAEPIENLFAERPTITFEVYDPKTYKTLETHRFTLSCMERLKSADIFQQAMTAMGKPLCWGISGMYA